MTQLGYAPASVRLQMKVLADLSEWLLNQGMAAADLRRNDLDRFLRHRRAAGHTRYASIRAVRPVLDYLQRVEVVPRQTLDAVLGPVDIMFDRFRRYLTVERALAAVTARAYLDMVRPFVQGRLSADCCRVASCKMLPSEFVASPEMLLERSSLRQLQTLQKRVRAWHQQAVQRLVDEISDPAPYVA